MDDLKQLIDAYQLGADQIRQAVGNVSESQADTVPVPGRWSLRQLVCHIADMDLVYADRIRRILTQENPLLPDADPDLYAARLVTPMRTLESELALIQSVRHSTAAILRACEPEDFQRTGVHSTDGPMTLETVLERITEHIPHHLPFVYEKLQALS